MNSQSTITFLFRLSQVIWVILASLAVIKILEYAGAL